MVLSIIFTVVYFALVQIFPRKGRKTMPKAAQAAFMMGFPILGVFAFIQEKLVERKYSAIFSDFDSNNSTESIAQVITPATDILLPIFIALIGAIAVIIGMVKVIKYPLSEEQSEYSKELTGSLSSDYQKKCAGYISSWGIIIALCSLPFIVGFIVYFAQKIPDLTELFAMTWIIGWCCVVLIFISLCIPTVFFITIPVIGYILSTAAIMTVAACLPQILGMIMCSLGFGMTFTAASIISICAAVRMKKSKEYTMGKTVLYIIGSLIPIVNFFTLNAIKKQSK